MKYDNTDVFEIVSSRISPLFNILRKTAKKKNASKERSNTLNSNKYE